MRIKGNNWAETRLAEHITESDSTIAVNNVQDFIHFPFRGNIEQEYIEVHGKDEVLNKLTGVIRGLEGSEADPHNIGSVVSCLFTAGVQMEIVNVGFAQKEHLTQGLLFRYYGGDFRNGNNLYILPDGEVVLNNDATNYIHICITDNIIKNHDSIITDGSVLLYEITTLDGEITSIQDRRSILYMGDGSGGERYTNTVPSVIEVGGIQSGTTFDDMSFGEFVDALLYPELFPNLTNPYAVFTSSVTGFREIGEDIATINFNVNFNRGSINPQYDSDEPYRSGLPNEYKYTGTGLVNQTKTDLSDSQSISNYIVQAGQQSWTVIVSYDGGVQPKGSKGTDYDSPLNPGDANPVTRTITGVYPLFATVSDISQLTKQTLVAMDSVVEIDLVAESGGAKQAIAFPDNWGAITQLQQWNALAGTWDTINLSTFDISIITKQIQGNTIDYTLYTHNGGSIGARKLRWAV